MSIVITDKVGVRVKGSYRDVDGKEVSFDFLLQCKRLDAEEIKSRVAENASTALVTFQENFLAEVAFNWKDMNTTDVEKTPIPFSEKALRDLLKIRGMTELAFNAYAAESGVREKN